MLCNYSCSYFWIIPSLTRIIPQLKCKALWVLHSLVKKKNNNKTANHSSIHHFAVTSLLWPHNHHQSLPSLTFTGWKRRTGSPGIGPRQQSQAHKTAPRIYCKFCSPLAAQIINSGYRFWEAPEGEEVHLPLTGTEIWNTTSQWTTHQFDLRLLTLQGKVFLYLDIVLSVSYVCCTAWSIRKIETTNPCISKNPCQGRFSFLLFPKSHKISTHYPWPFFPSLGNKSQHLFLHLMKSVGTGSSSDFAYLLFAISY